ncbi:MAG TPA: hypothetical protein VG817_02055 [Gemmatimonadales bacterium]|nr:hypothetical protein [Gemmatimonadales bacterium]
MNDAELDRLLRAERDTIPPAAPRDAMWDAIAARRQEKVVPIQSARRGPRLHWAVGIAALLAIGFAVGRWSQHGTTPNPVVATTERGGRSLALAGATLEHLNRTETFLTGFRMEAGMSQPDTELVSGARDLLSTTRLLLDSPGQTDPRMRALLEELETVLVQVAQLRNEPTEEAKLLARQLDEQGVLPRLRVSIPANPAHVTIIGES